MKCEYCEISGDTDYLQTYRYFAKSFPGNWGSASIILVIGNDPESELPIQAKVGDYLLAVDADGEGFTKINYCPMCGRHLINNEVQK